MVDFVLISWSENVQDAIEFVAPSAFGPQPRRKFSLASFSTIFYPTRRTYWQPSSVLWWMLASLVDHRVRFHVVIVYLKFVPLIDGFLSSIFTIFFSLSSFRNSPMLRILSALVFSMFSLRSDLEWNPAEVLWCVYSLFLGYLSFGGRAYMITLVDGNPFYDCSWDWRYIPIPVPPFRYWLPLHQSGWFLQGLLVHTRCP